MEKIKFKININATREKVWEILWSDKTYSKWASAFMDGTYAETDWKEGSKVKFLTPDGNGMLSMIEKSVPFEKMRFKHTGCVQAGKEDINSDEAEQWRGAEENYKLIDTRGHTLLEVEMDILYKYSVEFKESWPKALQKIKELAEENR